MAEIYRTYKSFQNVTLTVLGTIVSKTRIYSLVGFHYLTEVVQGRQRLCTIQ